MAQIRLDRLTIKNAGQNGTAFEGVFVISRDRQMSVEFPVLAFVPQSEEGTGIVALWKAMRQTMGELTEVANQSGPDAS